MINGFIKIIINIGVTCQLRKEKKIIIIIIIIKIKILNLKKSE